MVEEERLIKKIVDHTTENVFDILRKNGFEIVEKKNAYQRTEQLLYLIPKLKKSIKHNNKRIKDLLEYGSETYQSGKGVHTISNNPSPRISEDELVKTEINNIRQRNHIINSTIDWINDILNTFKEEKFYEIIRLKYYENKTNEEIAEYFGCDERTIRRNRNKLINDLKINLFPDDSIHELGC